MTHWVGRNVTRFKIRIAVCGGVVYINELVTIARGQGTNREVVCTSWRNGAAQETHNVVVVAIARDTGAGLSFWTST